MAKRISKANFLTPTAEWRLYKAEQLRLSSKQITAKLARLTGKSEKEIRKLYTAALKEALKNDEKIYRAAISEGYLSEDKNGVLNSYFGSVAFSNALKAGLQNTNGLMRNLCSSTAASANRLLSDELDLAFMKVTSGAFTADEAVFSAVKRLGNSGLTVVNYASGRKDKVDVAVRRAVITGIGQAAANVQLGLAADMGCDLVEVTAHLGARPTHQVWQGRIFSLSGTHPKYPEFRSSTGYGTGDGLCGWNCRHNFYPFFEGLSKPVGVPFTKEENDKVYRDTQKQRAYERAIRQSKRELAALDASRSAASDDDALKQKLDREFQRKAVVLKRREAKLAEHLRASGLLPDNSRVRVDGFGRSVSGKAVWAAKKANNGVQSSAMHLTNGDGNVNMKMGKSNDGMQPPDFAKYVVNDDPKSVERVRQTLIREFGLPEKNVRLDGIRNAEVLEPFVNQLVQIHKRTGFHLPNIHALEIIEGDVCCVADFKPGENRFYISSKYFNSKEALKAALKDWTSDKNKFFPQQAYSNKFIEYIAEHEAAHIRLPKELINSTEANKIWRKRTLDNDNDVKITEYFADVIAIYNTNAKSDANIKKAINYLIIEGVAI